MPEREHCMDEDPLMKILDPHLVSRDAKVEIQDGNNENLIPSVEKCLVSLFRIDISSNNG